MAEGRRRGRGEARLTQLEQTLRRTIKGEVLFDKASRGRYSTDASIYQVEPVGVVVPRDETDLALVIDVARDAKAAIVPRGAGTSQCGQTVGEALVIDVSKHLREVMGFDKDKAQVTVQPGVVLDQLNAWLKPHGLWYPVDVSTSAQCTLGGMAATRASTRWRSSSGSRSRHTALTCQSAKGPGLAANSAASSTSVLPLALHRSKARITRRGRSGLSCRSLPAAA